MTYPDEPPEQVTATVTEDFGDDGMCGCERCASWLKDALDKLNRKVDDVMTGLTDLNANVAAMQAEWATFLSDMTAALANEDSDAAVESAAQLVAAQTAAAPPAG
jgi:hypothetical protein